MYHIYVYHKCIIYFYFKPYHKCIIPVYIFIFKQYYYNSSWLNLEGLDGGYKCQLSVKILAICQLSVKFRLFVSCQLNGY